MTHLFNKELQKSAPILSLHTVIWKYFTTGILIKGKVFGSDRVYIRFICMITALLFDVSNQNAQHWCFWTYRKICISSTEHVHVSKLIQAYVNKIKNVKYYLLFTTHAMKVWIDMFPQQFCPKHTTLAARSTI